MTIEMSIVMNGTFGSDRKTEVKADVSCSLFSMP